MIMKDRELALKTNKMNFDYKIITEKYRSNKHRIIEVLVNNNRSLFIIQYKSFIFQFKFNGKYLFGDHWDSLTNRNDNTLVFNSFDEAMDFYNTSSHSTIKLLNNASNYLTK